MSYREKDLAKYLSESQVGFEATGGGGVFQLVRVDVPLGLAGGWVVTLCSDIDGTGVSAQRRAFARCVYGIGSAQNIVDVDWGAGCQFSVFGANVYVNAVLPQLLGPLFRAGNFRATVVPGVISPATPLTRTVYYPTLKPGASADEPIPRFAKRVWFECCDSAPPGVGWTATWLRGDPVAPLGLQFLEYRLDTQQQSPWPVAPQANQLRITNDNALPGGDRNLIAIYELAL